MKYKGYCKEFSFNYILRLDGNLKIGAKNKKLLKEINHSCFLDSEYISAWKESSNILITVSLGNIWYLATDLGNDERRLIIREYGRRFKIEKCFLIKKAMVLI